MNVTKVCSRVFNFYFLRENVTFALTILYLITEISLDVLSPYIYLYYNRLMTACSVV